MVTNSSTENNRKLSKIMMSEVQGVRMLPDYKSEILQHSNREYHQKGLNLIVGDAELKFINGMQNELFRDYIMPFYTKGYKPKTDYCSCSS
jgi:hypothetical protein